MLRLGVQCEGDYRVASKIHTWAQSYSINSYFENFALNLVFYVYIHYPAVIITACVIILYLQALTALKYMLLSKIMLGLAEDVHSIVMGKLALRHAGPEIEAMKAVAKSSQSRSLAEFQEALGRYKKELVDDPIIAAHLETLYDQMLEQNLCRIIEPYSRVQVDHVAKVIALPREKVELKLSQMILDKKFSGILDQGTGVLIIFEEQV